MRGKEDKGCNNCIHSDQSRNDICLSCSRYGIPRNDLWQSAERGRFGAKQAMSLEANEMKMLKELLARISSYHAIGVEMGVFIQRAGEIGIPEHRTRLLIEEMRLQGSVVAPIDGFLKPSNNQ
ncbi:MAG: hypothetical protein OEV21_03390 [Thermoplasmata archaeon]|nr:hypothetical protein [Thermoplasmata archaeon]